MSGYVYILASRKNGTLYTGVTSDLERRVWEHREELTGGFTKKYGAQTSQSRKQAAKAKKESVVTR